MNNFPRHSEDKINSLQQNSLLIRSEKSYFKIKTISSLELVNSVKKIKMIWNEKRY